jgi:hypothetical protein
MKLHLTLFVSYVKTYDEVRNSTSWNSANAAICKRFGEKLNRLAYDAMTSLLDAAQLYNQFLDYCALNNVVNYQWLGGCSAALTNAYNVLLREHPNEVNNI